MGNILGWIAYGVGVSIGRSLFALDRRAPQPVRTGTEEDFLEDEERFREDEKRIEAAHRRASSA